MSGHAVFTTPVYGVVDQGNYFNALSPTPGTGIAQTVVTAFSATDGVMCLFNAASTASSSGSRVFMDYIRLVTTVIPASATSSQVVVAIDNANRYTSGGSALTPVNANGTVGNATNATVNFGALVLTAETAAKRRLARAVLRSAIPVVQDETLLVFTSVDAPGAAGSMGGAVALRSVVPVGPAVIGPGQSLTVHIYSPANATTPPSYEVEMGWWES